MHRKQLFGGIYFEEYGNIKEITEKEEIKEKAEDIIGIKEKLNSEEKKRKRK